MATTNNEFVCPKCANEVVTGHGACEQCGHRMDMGGGKRP